MKFDSDLDSFFGDFQVDAILSNGSTIKVILDEPDQESLSLISGVNAQIIGKKSDLKLLNENDELTIDDALYSVKYIKNIDDGLTSIAYLTKE